MIGFIQYESELETTCINATLLPIGSNFEYFFGHNCFEKVG